MQSSFFPCKRYLFDGMALLDKKKKKKMGTQKGATHKIRWQWRQGRGQENITRELNDPVYLLLAGS